MVEGSSGQAPRGRQGEREQLSAFLAAAAELDAFLPHSRDRAPDLYHIKRAAEQLHAGGFEISVEVDTAPRAMGEAEADRARLGNRADALRKGGAP